LLEEIKVSYYIAADKGGNYEPKRQPKQANCNQFLEEILDAIEDVQLWC
jgi:hypothetical protein